MINIILAGDYSPRYRCDLLLKEGHYDSVFGDIKDILTNSDYSVANFETTIASNEDNPIKKYGPTLKCGEYAVEAAKYAGFKMFTLANNHFYDYGDVGVEKSIEVLQKYGMDYVGGGLNLKEARKIFYKIIKGKTIAFINCCEHEFSIATDFRGGSNPINPIQQFYDINEAKKQADYIIIVVHGGNEHYQLPSPRLKELYRYFIDLGADAVINHHQHCYSGYEIYNCRPIFYGIGNFCFDSLGKTESMWNRGYLVELILDETQISFSLHPYIQCENSPGVHLLKDEMSIKQFKDSIHELNAIISNDRLLNEHFKSWMDKSKETYLLSLEPYVGKILSSLYRLNLLPSTITSGRCLRLLNFINCEAHLERLRFAIETKYRK